LLPAANETQQPAGPGAGVAKPQARGRRGFDLPLWLLTVLSAIAFGLVGVGSFVAYRHFSGGSGTLLSSRPAASESAGGATSAAPGDQELLEYFEVTGLRVVEDKSKKSEVVFLAVNHAAAPLTDLSGTVTLRPNTPKLGNEVVGAFVFQHVSLGPYESRELRAPLRTTLRPYELPDWEFLRAEIALASPRKP
jgi:hypothetical protein